ncbi:uncharacterized protein HD556DRAFT_1318651 [Suillus plorans]|uniref:RING-type domain-containing protein n=1 Tax=Suillus plorans TaxID=116603 RepID=A0A9P7E3A8_9AGAM|nr:uncharacterized protein HD556DRAFT_1318651 [Suillus plorans]KAG1810187.1 hypothetical protein HD556DRAFT_1318651 [Suillus plorans]
MTSQLRAQATAPKRPPKMASNQSLNHLLNFTLPPRQIQPQIVPRRSKKAVHSAVWNKERFVNAQYRFVMNPSGDYTVHFADPDIFFQWHDILQVIIPRSSALASATVVGGERAVQEEGVKTCPICLSPPTAPRMTKCGHVYCFPCILHYLSMSEKLKWARCPVCFDTLNEKQLKSVKWYDGPQFQEDEPVFASGSSCATELLDHYATPRAGSTMRMRLMQRPQMTTLALPRSYTWPSDLIPPHQAPFHFLPDVYDYAKFMLATPEYLIADLSNDLDVLAVERRMMASMQDGLSISFIDAADQKIRHQIAKATALESPQLKEAIDRTRKDYDDITRRHNLEWARKLAGEMKGAALPEAPEEFLATGSSSGIFVSSHTPMLIPATPESTQARASVPTAHANTSNNRSHRQRRNINPPPPSTQTYYYYQAASGLPIYLHPLDIKILFSHFNSYASFPDTITVCVESATEGTVNDDLRKRCKYLAHTPEGADVVFIEADLEGVVDQEGLKNFEGAIKLRRSRRKEKGRKDDRARARAEEREREKVITPWTESVFSVPLDPVLHAVEVEGIANHESPTPQISGAWGSRSFASAAHSASGADLRHPNTNNRNTSQEIGDEWELDAAWHELEQRSTGGQGNKKKKGNKLVVMGSGVGGRRR